MSGFKLTEITTFSIIRARISLQNFAYFAFIRFDKFTVAVKLSSQRSHFFYLCQTSSSLAPKAALGGIEPM
jgi:hypothetical protein